MGCGRGRSPVLGVGRMWVPGMAGIGRVVVAGVRVGVRVRVRVVVVVAMVVVGVGLVLRVGRRTRVAASGGGSSNVNWGLDLLFGGFEIAREGPGFEAGRARVLEAR